MGERGCEKGGMGMGRRGGREEREGEEKIRRGKIWKIRLGKGKRGQGGGRKDKKGEERIRRGKKG